jgi:hypothetical protein
MTEAQPLAQRRNRAEAEHDAIDGLRPDGHARRRKGKTDQMFFRVTPEKKAQLHRLSELLSAGQPESVSYTETMERALDALEAKMKGKAK